MSQKARWASQGVTVPSRPRLPTQPAGDQTDAPQQQNRNNNPHRIDGPKLRLGVQAANKRDGRPSDKLVDISEAKRECEEDKYAASARSSRESVANTRRSYHAKARRLEPERVAVDVFPMTVPSLKCIAALMKLDGFRSFSNYASWAKNIHIELGHAWAQQLALEVAQAGRSLSRGIGPPRQSASFDLGRLAHLSSQRSPPSSGFPVFPKDTFILGCLWVLREIELAWAIWNDITIDMHNELVMWTLTVSKTDPMAKSCARKLGCLCAEFGNDLCPFHVMVRYRAAYCEHFELDVMSLVGSLPVFPDYEGKVVLKSAMVKSLETTLERMGESAQDCAGRGRFGGHTCRVAGSRFWAGHGLELYKVQVFARWGSSIILRYVADAPLEKVARAQPLAGASSSSGAGPSQSREVAELNAMFLKLSAFIQDAIAEVTELRAELNHLRTESRPSVVQNPATKCWRAVLLCSTATPPSLWKARRGWRFGLLPRDLRGEVAEDGGRCAKCFGASNPDAGRLQQPLEFT